MTMKYNNPAGGSASTIGNQLRTDHIIKQALIEAKKEVYFGALADTIAMPKNMGKKIKQYLYVPLLDDANINDQGIDANGVSTAQKATIQITAPGVLPGPNTSLFAVGTGATGAAATTAAQADAMSLFRATGLDTTNVLYDTYAEAKAYLAGKGWTINEAYTQGGSKGTVPETGNLYGSSKDVGTIVGKFPALSETGGRVNRVGCTRVELEGTLEKYGFYSDYTQESLDFDTDAELEQHINREMIFGANEMTEDMLQIDLLNAAGVIYFAGGAIADDELSGETGGVTEVTYGDLSRLSVELDNNRCPKHTKVISGSRMIDTRVIRGGRVMYIGSELIQTIEQMTDYFGNQAFVSVAHYADAGSVLNGEIGAIGPFRIVVVPEMMHWAGAGATETVANAGYRATGGAYDIFPMLVVGDGSFTTIGFQTSGNSVKFVIKHSKPGSPESYANDPFGETGFMSIKWYYGFMALRPERIALLKTVAKM